MRQTVMAVALMSVAAGLTGLGAAPVAAAQAGGAAVAAGGGSCQDASVTPSVEEARLNRPIQPGLSDPMAPQIIERAGLTPLVTRFARDLCRARTALRAELLIRRYGEKLWQAAVHRVQGPADTRPGALPVDDDRPLYWARLSMTRSLRQWTPSFPATATERAAWQKQLEYTSRGLTTSRFAFHPGVRRLFVSGFDPFGLDTQLRTANPSGASALHLDGRL